MQTTNTVIIGGGQAGLAMSRCLTEDGVDHVVLERGRVANSWRTRWDSLHLLTPNWMTRLPGYSYSGSDPDGFMSRGETIAFLEGYGRSFDAPVIEGVTVTSVTHSDRFLVDTDLGRFHSTNVVVATGNDDLSLIPRHLAGSLHPSIAQFHSKSYRNPDVLAAGGVLVVGGGPSGLQIAHELGLSGRRTILSVGRHSETPRSYRGKDFWWWLDEVGSLSDTAEEVGDLDKARRLPSLGLTGVDGGVDLNLDILALSGAEVVGRLVGAGGHGVVFSDNLANDRQGARQALERLLDRFDMHATATGIDLDLGAPSRPAPLAPALPHGSGSMDLTGISNVIWCTGFRRSYPWLRLPVLDDRGEIIQWNGMTPMPGLFVLGRQFQRSRRSHFIDGVGDDARYLAARIAREVGPVRTVADATTFLERD